MNFKQHLIGFLVLILIFIFGCGYSKEKSDIRYAKRVLSKSKKSNEELIDVRRRMKKVIDMKIRAVNILDSVDRFLGRRYMEDGDYNLAVDVLKEAESLKPMSAYIKKDIGECYYFLARSAVDAGKRKECLELSKGYLKKALELKPDMIEAMYVMSLLLFFGYNDIDAAIDEAKKILTIDPKNIDAHFALGRFYYEEGEYGRALNEYITLTKILPKNSPKRKKVEENILKINRMESVGE